MASKMKAAALVRAGEPLEILELEVPRPGPGQILVKIEVCGLCHTDLHFWAGDHPLPRDLPVVLGHEGIGRIEALGSGVTGLQIGQRVGVGFVFGACGACRECLTGHETYCGAVQSTSVHVDGCFAEYALLRADWATPIPGSLDPAEAAPLLCAGVAAYSAVRKARLEPGELAVVFGAGGLGGYAIQIAKAFGARVAAVDLSRKKLDHALALGADYALAADEDPVAALQALGGANACFNFAPVAASWRQMIGCAGTRARLVLISLPTEPLTFEAGEIIEAGLEIKGSADGTRQELRQLIALAEAGALRSTVERVPFERINEAFGRLASGQVEGRLVIDLRAAA